MLGPLEVTRDGQRVPVPGGKTSELVVRLALEAGAPVGADRLVDDLWSAGGRSTRRNTLQSKVAMLRRAFGDPSVIDSRDGGYALAVDPSDVDAIAVLGAVATASVCSRPATTAAPPTCVRRRCSCTAGTCFRQQAMANGSTRTARGSKRRG